MNHKTKEPLFHVVKRGEIRWYQAWGIRALAIVLALAVCAVVTMLLTGERPLSVFVSMVYGGFGTQRKSWILLQNMAILLCVSVALAPAFRMRFWNIGGEGQIMIGCLATAACMIYLSEKLPAGVLIPLMFICSTLAGAIWGLIPAFFKAHFNTNETLFTLMMNYVATQVCAYFIIIWESPKGSGKVGMINQKTQAGWLPNIADNKYLLNVLIVVLVTILMYIYLNYTKHGYEIAVVGESQNTASYIGLSVPHVILRTMMLSGAICGLAGFLLVSGTDHTITTTISGGRGFTAVMVAWLGKCNPIWMVFASFLMIFLGRGASEISTSFGLNDSFGDIMTGIIIFFIIGSEFFIHYKLSFRTHSGNEPAGAGKAVANDSEKEEK